MCFVKKIILIGCLLILSNPAIAADLPSPTGYVNDFAGVLDSSTKGQLEQLLTAFEVKTGEEIAVATVPSLEGTPIEDYAVRLYKQWGIGKKGKDKGVLILVAPGDRQVRIEVGYGLEGIINDAMAGRIIRERMIPAFKEGNFDGGIIQGSQTIVALLAKQAGIEMGNGGEIPAELNPLTPKNKLLHKIASVIFFLFIAYLFIRHPWLFLFFISSGMGGGGRSGGGFSGGFGGFGGGMSGGGGASGRW